MHVTICIMTSRLAKIAFLALLIAGAVGCRTTSMRGSGGKSTTPRGSDGDTVENQPEDPPRPRDEGEGVPGFELVPEKISVALADERFVVTGAAGAVVNAPAMPPLTIWYVDATRFDDTTPAPSAGLGKTIVPDSNGAFSISLPGSENFHVAIVASATASDSLLNRAKLPTDRTTAVIATAPAFGVSNTLTPVAQDSAPPHNNAVFRFYNRGDHAYALAPSRKAGDKLELLAFRAFRGGGPNRVKIVECVDSKTSESTLAKSCSGNDKLGATFGYLATHAEDGLVEIFACSLTTGGKVVDRFVTVGRTECENAGYQTITSLGWAL